MHSGGEQICFNPELLGGFDTEAAAYQANVDKLTGGNLPSSEVPCADEDQVPSSFLLSGLDPADPRDVFEYVTHPYYHQTAVCLEEENRRSPKAAGSRPFDLTPALPDRKRWLADPHRVLSDWDPMTPEAETSSAALVLTTLPQNDQTLEGILNFLFFHTDGRCVDFTLVGAYHMASKLELKNQITKRLLRRQHHRQALRNNFPLTPEESALHGELATSLFPIFAAHYESLPSEERGTRRDVSNAITDMRGEGPLKWVVQKLQQSGGDIDGVHVRALLNYIAQAGEGAVPYFRGFLEAGAIKYTEDFRKDSARAWALIDDPRAQNELFACITGGCRLAETSYGALRSVALTTMVNGDVPAAREKLLRVLGEEFDPLDDEMKRQLIYQVGHYQPWSTNPENGFRYVTALEKLRGKVGEHPHLLFDIDEAQGYLAYRYDYSPFWRERLETLDEHSQFVIVTTWLYQGIKSSSRGDTTPLLNRLSPALRDKIEARMLNKIDWPPDENVVLATVTSPDFSDSFKSRFLEKIAQTDARRRLLLAIADSDRVEIGLRARALETFALLNEDGLEKFLLENYILNPQHSESLRKAAVEALKLRGERLPTRRPAVIEALRSIAPLPASVTQSAAEALRNF